MSASGERDEREEEEAQGGIRRRRSNREVSDLHYFLILRNVRNFMRVRIIFLNVNYFEHYYNLDIFIFYSST